MRGPVRPQLQCVGDKELAPLDTGAALVEPGAGCYRCVTKHYTVVANFSPSWLERPHPVLMYRNCDHNALVGLRNRVLARVPPPSRRGVRALRAQAWRVCKLLPTITPWELERVVAGYTGAKRRAYEIALARLLAQGVDKHHAKVTAFVKVEKLFEVREPKDPRIIQFRDRVYCLALGAYIKPIEHALYRLRGRGGGDGLPPTRVIAKGMNQRQRAELLWRKWEAFDEPVALAWDMKRFDMHVSRELLTLEHFVYTRMCPDKRLKKLLSWQLRNKGATHNRAIKYRVTGRRMSGDANTASGNCITMVLMVSTALRGLKYELLDDGDDCVVIVECSDLGAVQQRMAQFLEFGMEVTEDGRAYEFEHIDFCQCRPVLLRHGVWFMVRKPSRVLQGCLTGTRYLGDVSQRAALVHTIGLCELALHAGVPILQELALALIRNAGTTKVVSLQENDDLFYRIKIALGAFDVELLREGRAVDITPEARLSFAKAFDIDVAKQHEIEQHLRTLSFGVDGGVDFFQEFDLDWEITRLERREVY